MKAPAPDDSYAGILRDILADLRLGDAQPVQRPEGHKPQTREEVRQDLINTHRAFRRFMAGHER